MRARVAIALLILVAVNGCLSTRAVSRDDETLTGLASWYGQEFAGRTTANGEIFDPNRMTAAHRTLPFGTLLEVKNPKNAKSVQVRINDRGPFVGNRILDLSYAAAAALEMVDTGVAEVELRIVKMGAGDREPPVPLIVDAGAPVRVVTKNPTPVASAPPPIEFPLPDDVRGVRTTTREDEVEVGQVEVQVERAGTVVRKQVGEDGRAIEIVPAPGAPRSGQSPAPAPPPAIVPAEQRHVVQLGAFQSDTNANALADRARAVVSDRVYVELFNELHRVRVGPFTKREAAIEVKEKLEAAGIASIVVTE